METPSGGIHEIHTIKGPVILGGHSYGGAVITNAPTGDKQVKALVYVDALAPAQGQTIGQLVTAHPGSCVLPPANVIVTGIGRHRRRSEHGAFLIHGSSTAASAP
jgi:pimeloyl-ACP methyl ester carboxylesterase